MVSVTAHFQPCGQGFGDPCFKQLAFVPELSGNAPLGLSWTLFLLKRGAGTCSSSTLHLLFSSLALPLSLPVTACCSPSQAGHSWISSPPLVNGPTKYPLLNLAWPPNSLDLPGCFPLSFHSTSCLRARPFCPPFALGISPSFYLG